MKKIICTLLILPLLAFTSCGKDKKTSENTVSGTNTLSTQGMNYQFCGTLVSQSNNGNFLFSNFQMPLRLYPENYSQAVQNSLNSAGSGRSACVFSRSEPQYEYGLMTFYVEAIQFQ